MDLTQGKCWRVILLFSLPVILSYLLQQVYSISEPVVSGNSARIFCPTWVVREGDGVTWAP